MQSARLGKIFSMAKRDEETANSFESRGESSPACCPYRAFAHGAPAGLCGGTLISLRLPLVSIQRLVVRASLERQLYCHCAQSSAELRKLGCLFWPIRWQMPEMGDGYTVVSARAQPGMDLVFFAGAQVTVTVARRGAGATGRKWCCGRVRRPSFPIELMPHTYLSSLHPRRGIQIHL